MIHRRVLTMDGAVHAAALVQSGGAAMDEECGAPVQQKNPTGSDIIFKFCYFNTTLLDQPNK